MSKLRKGFPSLTETIGGMEQRADFNQPLNFSEENLKEVKEYTERQMRKYATATFASSKKAL